MEAIVVAAMRILEREGLERLTTTRIAELAGVSVGSLYQYFPNRGAIIGAIIDRQLEATLAAFRMLVANQADVALEPLVTGVLFGMLEAIRGHGQLHASLFAEMSAAQRTRCHSRALEAYVDVIVSVLDTRRDVAMADTRAAARLIVHASDGVIRSLVAAPDAVTTPVVLQEAARMITRYLARRHG